MQQNLHPKLTFGVLRETKNNINCLFKLTSRNRRLVWIFIVVLFIAPFSSIGSHIIGGELNYVSLGNFQYEVTLKLYRNCYDPLADYPDPAVIEVFNADGSDAGFTIDIPFPGADTLDLLYGNQCFIPPTDVCVQEAIYIDTVTFAPQSPEFLLAFNLCCRNGSVLNLNNPSNQRATYTELVHFETIANNVSVGPLGASRDSSAGNTGSVDYFNWGTIGSGNLAANDGIYDTIYCNSMDNNDMTEYLWALGHGFNIPTGAIIHGIQVEIDRHVDPDREVDDEDIYIVKNGVATGTDHENNTDWRDFDQTRTYGNATDLWGTTWTAADINSGNFGVAIAAESNSGNNNVNTTIYVDYVGITVWYSLYDDIANNSPEFNNFPPIFVCIGDTLKFDHTANDTVYDADGDSLVYSLCEPYEDYSNGNTPPIDPVNWAGGFNGTNQLGGGANVISIDALTGELIAYPTLQGQYQLGMCATEYREDTVLYVHKRDFQFNAVACVAIVSSAVPSYNPPCGNNTVTFQNDSSGAFTQFWDFGDPSVTNDTSYSEAPTWTYSDTGTYTVTLIINQGLTCADTGTATVTVRRAVDAGYTFDGTCALTTINFTDTSTVSLGTLDTWQWSFPSGTPATTTAQNPSVSFTSGVHNVELIVGSDAGANCSDTANYSITITDAPTVDAGNNASMCGGSTALIGGSPTASGSGTSFTYSWTNSASLDDGSIANPTSNTTITAVYQVSVIDNFGCSNTDDVTVTPSSIPTANAGSNLSNCSGSGIVIGGAPTATGGGTSYTYSWSNSGSLDDGTIANPTSNTTATITYSVTITDNNGCTDVDAVTVTPNALPTADAGSNSSLCQGSNLIIGGSPTAIGGGTSYTYDWSNSGSLDDGTIANPTSNTTATTTYSVTVTDNNGCIDVDAVTVTSTGIPTANAGNDVSMCGGTTAIIGGSPTASGAGTSYTYLWSNSGSLDNGAIANPTSNATVTTVYDLTVTNNFSCTATDAMTVTPSSLPTADAGNNVTICEGNSVAIGGTPTATGGGSSYTYSWSNSSTLDDGSIANPTSSTTITTTYSITVTDNNGCFDIDVVSVTVNPAPTVNAGSSAELCSDVGSVALAGSSSNGTVSWSTNGDGTFSNNAIDNPTYNFGTTDQTGGVITLTMDVIGNAICGTATDAISLTITPAPVANASGDWSICEDETGYTIIGASSANGTLSWTSSGDGTFVDASIDNPTYNIGSTDITNSLVTLTMNVSANGSCSGTSNDMILSISPGPTIDAGLNDTTCANNAVITLNGSVAVASGFTWVSLGSGSFDNATNPTAVYTASTGDISTGSVQIYNTSTGNGGCIAVNDTMLYVIQPTPIVDAGNDTTICPNLLPVQLSASVTGATGIVWTTSGTGTFSNSTLLSPTYTPTTIDTSAGLVTLYTTTTGNGFCSSITDSLVIDYAPLPVIDAGNDTVICNNVPSIPLNGTVSGGPGAVWSSLGFGSFTPNDSTLNGNYLVAPGDVSGGLFQLVLSSYGGCLVITDTINVTVTPFVDAGADTAVCSGTNSVVLNGTLSNAGGITWSSLGDGTFVDNTDLNTTYNFGTNDITNTSFTLVLTSTGNGSCPAAKDSIDISILAPPSITVGADTTVCKSQVSIQVSGTVTNSTGGFWTSTGSGTFSPNDSLLTTTYFLSSGDTALSSVDLIFSNFGGCAVITDTITIDYLPAVLVDAGSDQIICSGQSVVNIAGGITNATGGIWSTTGTGSFTNSTSLTTDYFPTSADTLSGIIYLTLTSTGNGLCETVADSIQLSFTSSEFADAGPDIAACSFTPPVAMNGVITNATGALWTTLGTGGFFDNSSLLNTNYTPSPLDTLNGSVDLVLTTNGLSCLANSDTMTLSFIDPPTTNAGSNITNCVNILGEPLFGSATNASGYGWTTLGSGSFNPDTFSLTNSYISSISDTTAGSVSLVLTAFGFNGCPSASDTIDIVYSTGPSVDAGGGTTTCANSPLVTLTGTVLLASGGTWTSNGTGTFADVNSLSTTYTASNIDTALGSVTIYLTTTGIGTCSARTDSVEFIFDPLPIANAGADNAVCVTSPVSGLAGSVSNATGSVWSTNGTGSFSSAADLNANYYGTPADTAAGSVFIFLTTTGNSLCPANEDTMVLSFTPDMISVFAGNDSIICSATTQLNGVVNIATGGVWTTSGTGTFLPADSLLNASYQFSTADTSAGTVNLYLTSTGNGGCLGSSDTVTYSFADLITLNASVFDTTCAIPFPIPINVSVSTGSIIWSTLGDGTFDPSATAASSNYIPGATDLINGSVILIATSQNNGTCAAQTDTSLITFVPAPTADFTSTQVCANDSTQFTDASFAVDGIINWFWGFENGDTSIAQNPSYSFSLGGIYNVTLTVTSTNGCTDTTVASVTVSSDPLAGFTSTANCFVDSVVFSDTSFVNIGSISNWDWDFGDGNSDTIQNPINFYPGPGSYDVTLIVTSSDGCVDSIVIATSVNPNPFADFTYIINCVNQPIVFNDASSVSSGSIANWEWDFGNTLTSTTQNPNANFTDDISYDVELIVTSDSGCVDTVIQSIIPYSLPITDFDAIGLCLEDGTQFNDLSTVNGSSIVAWEWDFGNGNQTTEQSPEYFYSTSGTYAVTFITESAQGCVDTLQQAITVNPSPTAAFTMSPLIVELFENIVFTDQSTDAVTWDWNFGDGIGTDVSPNPEYSYLDTGLFVTELIIENQYGCPDTATGEIAVVMTPIVPAGFSPDGNGENDILYVLGGPYTSLDFKIYNNWGELIFTSRDQGNGWDGTRDGVDQPIGVYIFTLDAVRLDGTEYKQVHGDITLLR